MYKFFTSEEIANLLNVSNEYFHREIKKLIKADFKAELKEMDIANPDILLDDSFKMRLADPQNHDKYYDTDLEIQTYIE